MWLRYRTDISHTQTPAFNLKHHKKKEQTSYQDIVYQVGLFLAHQIPCPALWLMGDRLYVRTHVEAQLSILPLSQVWWEQASNTQRPSW